MLHALDNISQHPVELFAGAPFAHRLHSRHPARLHDRLRCPAPGKQHCLTCRATQVRRAPGQAPCMQEPAPPLLPPPPPPALAAACGYLYLTLPATTMLPQRRPNHGRQPAAAQEAQAAHH